MSSSPSCEDVPFQNIDLTSGFLSLKRISLSHGSGEGFDAAEIDLSCAEDGQCVYMEERARARFPESGQIALGEFFNHRRELFGRERGDDDDALAFLFIGQRGDGEYLLGDARQFLQFVFNADV